VLKDATGPNEFTFTFKLRGLKVEQADGCISFVNSQGEAVFWLGVPFAFDDAQIATDEVTYEVVDSGAGNCRIKVTLSAAYLADPARVFPVVVDPEVILYPPTADTYVASASAYDDTNFVNSPYLRTGQNSNEGRRRTFIKFSNLPAIDPDDVTDAHLRIERNTSLGGVAPLINAWWSLEYFACDSMTWNSGTPHWDGTSSDDFGSPESTLGALNGGNWYEMHCTTPVKYWLAGTRPNYGWMIKEQRESTLNQCTAFYSSNYGSPHRPELHITYANHVVYTRLACDYLFKDRVGGWSNAKTVAKNALETADDAFMTSFGIDFLLRSSEEIKPWWSPIDACDAEPSGYCSLSHYYAHIDPTTMLSNARTQLTMQEVDVMVCITGAATMKDRYEDTDYYTEYPGYTAYTADECIVAYDYHNWEYETNIPTYVAIRHELSHCFGPVLNHSTEVQCVMWVTDEYSIPYPWGWCSTCASTIYGCRAKFD
jgi:hypothetical protein